MKPIAVLCWSKELTCTYAGVVELPALVAGIARTGEKGRKLRKLTAGTAAAPPAALTESVPECFPLH